MENDIKNMCQLKPKCLKLLITDDRAWDYIQSVPKDREDATYWHLKPPDLQDDLVIPSECFNDQLCDKLVSEIVPQLEQLIVWIADGENIPLEVLARLIRASTNLKCLSLLGGSHQENNSQSLFSSINSLNSLTRLDLLISEHLLPRCANKLADELASVLPQLERFSLSWESDDLKHNSSIGLLSSNCTHLRLEKPRLTQKDILRIKSKTCNSITHLALKGVERKRTLILMNNYRDFTSLQSLDITFDNESAESKRYLCSRVVNSLARLTKLETLKLQNVTICPSKLEREQLEQYSQLESVTHLAIEFDLCECNAHKHYEFDSKPIARLLGHIFRGVLHIYKRADSKMENRHFAQYFPKVRGIHTEGQESMLRAIGRHKDRYLEEVKWSWKDSPLTLNPLPYIDEVDLFDDEKM